MTDQTSIEIAAGARAFGDGSHPTTQGALAALEGIDPAMFTPRNACDMGAGSGLTALAIHHHFRCPVIAADIMADAVATLRDNIAATGTAHAITPVHSDGFSHPAITQAAPYDLILMNILAEPILRHAATLDAHLAEGGVAILGGILTWQEQPIVDGYHGLGMELTSRLTIGDWVTLVFQKP